MKYGFIKRFTVLFIVTLIFLPTVCIGAFAESSDYVAYESYTYWENISGKGRKLVKNKPMYKAEFSVTAKSLGIENFTELIDVCVAKNGDLYLLDSASRIVVLDKDYNVLKEISEIKSDKKQKFKGAQNIYVHTDNTVYISDTENKRVIHCDSDGNYIDEFVKPKSSLIPKDFSFKPIGVAVDSRGYVYVLCRGSYYGALLYAPDKSFIGFYGSNDVTNGIIGAISSLFNRMFPNNEKSDRKTKSLPYSFNDIIVDDDDFVYTATDSSNYAQVKKLNPGAGNNILDSAETNFADDDINRTYLGYNLKQKIVSVAVDNNGFIYCLDSAIGRVYLYDSDCRMLTAFGGGLGNGTQLGTFAAATAVVLNGEDVVVCDKLNNSLTVFTPNSFCKNVKKSVLQTLTGNYEKTKNDWEQIIKEDRNLQVAYNGLARAYLSEKDYDKAMETALAGYDRETYVLAYKYQRKIWISDNFVWMFSLAIAIIAFVIALIVVKKKKNITFVKNEEIRLMFGTLFHPGNSFEAVKDNKKGSVKLSALILVLFYISAVTKQLLGGFLFTGYDPATFNSLWVLVQSLGLVVLWIVSNILVCSLLDGKGTVREIIIVTSYSIIPLIFERAVWTVLTNFLLPDESAFLGIINAAALIWTALLLITGMLKIHRYSFGKFVGTSVLSIIGMACIAFLMVLVGMLLQQLGGFITTVLTELLY